MTEKIIPLSGKAQEQWSSMRAALNEAARPFTEQETLALSPFYAHDIPFISREMDQALKSIKSENVAASFVLMGDGKIGIELHW